MGLRAYLALGSVIALMALTVLVKFHLNADARMRDRLDRLTEQAGAVLVATRDASGNPKLTWPNVPGQVVAIGEDRRDAIEKLEEQTQRVDEMAREAVRLRAKSAELRKIAERAEAQRAAALRRLSGGALTPGTRGDCMTLLREAEDALDELYEAGF